MIKIRKNIIFDEIKGEILCSRPKCKTMIKLRQVELDVKKEYFEKLGRRYVKECEKHAKESNKELCRWWS